jgi:predicted GNAT family acetyltransferase
MRLQVFSTPQEFWEGVAPELRQEEARNCLLLGICKMLAAKPGPVSFQAAVYSDQRLLASILMSEYLGNLNLLLSTTRDREALAALFSAFQKTNLRANALQGGVATVNEFASHFRALGAREKIHMRQGVYRCRAVIQPKVSGDMALRLATLEDIDFVADWVHAFQVEAIPHEVFDSHEMAKARIKAAFVYLLTDSGEPVAMAGTNRDIGTSASVNLVYTPQALRGRGYGSLVTAKLTQQLLDQGKRETNLFTDLDNPTSNKIYQNIGYEMVDQAVHLGLIWHS